MGAISLNSKIRAGRRVFRGHGPLLRQPYGIPKRVIADAPGQSCPHWIGDNIPGGLQQILLPPQRMIVVRPVPQRPFAPYRPVGPSCAGGFQPVHRVLQAGLFAQLRQAMKMVGHQNPGQQARVSQHRLVLEGLRGSLRGFEIGEKRLAFQSRRGDQVDLSFN